MSAAVALVSVLKKQKRGGDARREDEDSKSKSVLTLTQEARLLVKALQENDISEDELLRMVNMDMKDFDPANEQDGEQAAKYAVVRRARRIFKHLDINNDGVIAKDDLAEIKGRFYAKANSSSDTLQKLRDDFMKNNKAVEALRKKAADYLEHRQGYALCFVHLVLFGVFASLLALQADTQLEWEVRSAVSQAVFPESVFEQDITMINEIELLDVSDIGTWFQAAFAGTNGVFADPDCGDGDCDAPLEHKVWRDSNNQQGCRIDCKSWGSDSNSTLRAMQVYLWVHDTLSTAEQETVRWNLVCPTVQRFEEQLLYFETDQTLDGSPWTLFAFDCDWELRVYAPEGGVSGNITFAATPQNATMIHDVALTEEGELVYNEGANRWQDKYVYEWNGCESPTPELNQVLGSLYLCSDEVDVFFNESVFLDNADLLRTIEHSTKDYVLTKIRQDLISYSNIAPSCVCAGPDRQDCFGEPCPSTLIGTDLTACPTLCDDEPVRESERELCSVAGEYELANNVTCGLGPPMFNPADPEAGCVDCNGCDCSDFVEWRGDDVCDDGRFGLAFNCGPFACDGGDCVLEGSCTNSTIILGQSRSQSSGFSPPCAYDSTEISAEDLDEAFELKVKSFAYFRSSDPDCVVFQLKSRTENGTEGDFIRDKWEELATNFSGDFSLIVERPIANMSAALGEPYLAKIVVELAEPVNSTCDTNLSCVLDGYDASSIISIVNQLGYTDVNPCELMKEVYGCSTDGCGCPYPSCNIDESCNGRSCDDFPYTSCLELEDVGCDCSGCECAAGDDCPRTCFGMTCAQVANISTDSVLGYYLENPEYVPNDFTPAVPFIPQNVDFDTLETVYGCNCDGCEAPRRGSHSRRLTSQEFDDVVEGLPERVGRRRLQPGREFEYASFYYSYFDFGYEPGNGPEQEEDSGNAPNAAKLSVGVLADETPCSTGCSRTMLLNNVCDRACATAACDYDFYDCCTPTFMSSKKSLETHSDTTIMSIQMENEGGTTPYDAWDSASYPKRYIANKHRIVAGVLFDQTRKKLELCNSSTLATWASTRTGQQVVDALTEDMECEISSNQITTAGSDPVFEPRSSLFNAKLEASVCHEDPSQPGGFPFVRFPSVGNAQPLLWGATMTGARAKYQESGFFDLTNLTDSEAEQIEGGYPVFFDNSFDYERTQRYISYMQDGYYVHSDTTDVTVRFLLFQQDIPLVTFVRVAFSIEDSGALKMTKDISIFDPTPYDGSAFAILRIVLEIGFILGIVINIVEELRQFVDSCRKTGDCRAHFRSWWNILDVLTIILQIVSTLLWVECLTSLTAAGFSPRMHYDVYNIDPACPGANLARFNYTELTELRLQYASAEHYAARYTAYRGVCTVVFVLMTLQLLKVLHFQPKLSLITRTMGAAWDDLTHLFILFFLVELAFALLGHVIYGSTIAEFATLGKSFTTLLLGLFGNFDFALNLGELYGFQGYLYYFLYMAIAFLLLMNMLLAILVDAYINVKEFSDQADGVFTDMYRQSKAAVRSLNRDSTIISNEEVVDKLGQWLEHQEERPSPIPRVPVSHEYDATLEDMRRLLHHFLKSEHALNQKVRGSINAETADEEANQVAASLLHHYGSVPKDATDTDCDTRPSEKVHPQRPKTPLGHTLTLMQAHASSRNANEEKNKGVELQDLSSTPKDEASLPEGKVVISRLASNDKDAV